MSVNVKVKGKIIKVPTGAAEYAALSLVEGTKNVKEMRTYLAEQRVSAPLPNVEQYGYVDFDSLTKDGKPVIVGEFYKDTEVGRILSGLPHKKKF